MNTFIQQYNKISQKWEDNVTKFIMYQNFKFSWFPQTYSVVQLFSEKTIINVSWAANQNILIFSEGSCDSEDWSIDVENSTLITTINYILQYIQDSYLKLYCHNLYCVFEQINSAFVSKKYIFKIHLKIAQTLNFWMVVYNIKCYHIIYSKSKLLWIWLN